MSTSTASTGQAKAAAAAETVFQVEDMTCSHCAGVISRALKDGMPGVPCTVDLETQRVSVGGDPAVAAALIRDAGYEPRLASA